jgi:glycosyltransferase involved in cell wall biosynthesis
LINGQKNKVSVIMPCFNSVAYLEKSVRSILSQTCSDFELIIVDDHSTDKTYDMASRLSSLDSRICLLKNRYTKGISGAVNTGIDAATGEYLTRMDSDDISLPRRLEAQTAFLDSNQVYGICSVNICLINSFGLSTTGPLFRKTEVPLEWMFLWENPIANAPAMVRKSLVDAFNIKYRDLTVAEDYDFLSRVALHTRVYQLQDVLYRYRKTPQGAFLKNKPIAISNSIVVSENYAKEIGGSEMILFHRFFSEFCRGTAAREFTKRWPEVLSYAVKLLVSAQSRWLWNETDYTLVQHDMIRRVLKNSGMSTADRSVTARLNDYLYSKKRHLSQLAHDVRGVFRHVNGR